MNEEILKGVQMVYDYEPDSLTEELAFAEMIGGLNMYRAIRIFKIAKKPPEDAVKFIQKLNDKINIVDLLGGGL